MAHRFDPRTECCLACGKPRIEATGDCDRPIPYREVLLVQSPAPILARVPVHFPLTLSVR